MLFLEQWYCAFVMGEWKKRGNKAYSDLSFCVNETSVDRSRKEEWSHGGALLGEKETRELFYRFSAEYCVSQENHYNCAKFKLFIDGNCLQ
jgi:hypothetical protein